MVQSLSGGSGKPFRMTLTLICSLHESLTIAKIIACAVRCKRTSRDYAGDGEFKRPKRKLACATAALQVRCNFMR